MFPGEGGVVPQNDGQRDEKKRLNVHVRRTGRWCSAALHSLEELYVGGRGAVPPGWVACHFGSAHGAGALTVKPQRDAVGAENVLHKTNK